MNDSNSKSCVGYGVGYGDKAYYSRKTGDRAVYWVRCETDDKIIDQVTIDQFVAIRVRNDQIAKTKFGGRWLKVQNWVYF